MPKEKEFISTTIADIMINDGPDGHCDGADIIADFFEAYLEGKQDEWIKEYYSKGRTRHGIYL